MKTTSYTLLGLIYITSVSFAQSPTPTPPVLDHFKAYVTDGASLGVPLLLRDQFDATPQSKTVDKPFRFANPVQKVFGPVITPITNPDTHLELYRLLPLQAPTIRYVQINNQFGLQILTVADPVALGVPTQKNGIGSPHDVDHFKFYNATGNALNLVVDLTDQFHQEPNVLVGRPRYFGNPVEKNHSGIITPIAHPNDFLVWTEVAKVCGTIS